MGVTLRCKKTGHDIDMGYSGFNRFRDKVATLYSDGFGKHYTKLNNPSIDRLSDDEFKAYFEKYDRITEQMITDKKLSIKVADFCYQPDCEGSINYGACGVIYNIIKDYDDNLIYGYAGRENPTKFADLKALFKECYDNKSKLVWY